MECSESGVPAGDEAMASLWEAMAGGGLPKAAIWLRGLNDGGEGVEDGCLCNPSSLQRSGLEEAEAVVRRPQVHSQVLGPGITRGYCP